MTTVKKNCAKKIWHLYTGGKDGSKRWFLYRKHPETGKRVRDYADLGRIHDLAQRRIVAERLVEERNAGGDALPAEVLSDVATRWLKQRFSDRPKSNRAWLMGAQRWERWLKEHGATYATVTEEVAMAYAHRYSTAYVAIARSLVQTVVAAGQRAANPFKGVRNRKEHLPAPVIPPALVAVALRAASGHDVRLGMLCKLLYHCFIRPQEQVRLEIRDIDLAERRILIPGSKSKNRRSQYVVIPDTLLPELESYLDKLPSQQRYLFEQNGKPYSTPNSFRVMHRKSVGAVKGIPGKVQLYSWKHTGAVAAAKANVPLKQLQLQLRHASLDQVNAYLRQMGVEDMDAVRKGW